MADRGDHASTQPPRRRVIWVEAAYPAVRRGIAGLLREDARFEVVERLPGAASLEGPWPDARVVYVGGGSVDEGWPADESMAEVPTVFVVDGRPEELPPLDGGAVALVAVDADGPVLSLAVEAVISGLHVIDRQLAAEQGLALRTVAPAAPGTLDLLTGRELQVLELVAAGLANKAIAARLGISEHTAKFHVASILAKLGAESRTEAVTIATRRGIITI